MIFLAVDPQYFPEVHIMNSKKKTYNQKHLTMTQRIWIEKGLNDNESFASIARRIEKDPTTILKEVKPIAFSPNEVKS